jgi:hypothetical protein
MNREAPEGDYSLGRLDTLRLSGGHKTAHPFPFHCACINRAIALVAKGELPLQTKATEGARDILAAVHAKFYAARRTPGRSAANRHSHR